MEHKRRGSLLATRNMVGVLALQAACITMFLPGSRGAVVTLYLVSCSSQGCHWASFVSRLDGKSCCPDHGVDSCARVKVPQTITVRCKHREYRTSFQITATEGMAKSVLRCERHQ